MILGARDLTGDVRAGAHTQPAALPVSRAPIPRTDAAGVARWETVAEVSTETFEQVTVTNVLCPVRFVERFHDLVPPTGTIAVMSSGQAPAHRGSQHPRRHRNHRGEHRPRWSAVSRSRGCHCRVGMSAGRSASRPSWPRSRSRRWCCWSTSTAARLRRPRHRGCTTTRRPARPCRGATAPGGTQACRLPPGNGARCSRHGAGRRGRRRRRVHGRGRDRGKGRGSALTRLSEPSVSHGLIGHQSRPVLVVPAGAA